MLSATRPLRRNAVRLSALVASAIVQFTVASDVEGQERAVSSRS